jgi:peptidoglycan/LPS O-acetylase OafA/YrhL
VAGSGSAAANVPWGDNGAPLSSTERPAAADRFRPDLEGLRAVAVVLVVLFHAGVPGFRGGYVGVDVFFVLSGFLITGLLVRELQRTGMISLVNFYARRARRLLPAAAVALAVTVIASAWLLPPLLVPGVATDGITAALYSANMRYALQATDYLQAELAPSPLLHFWSLGVEEQFYLFWPALLLFAVGRRAFSIRRIAVIVVLVGVGSFALSTWLTEVAQPWAFFSLPARAWELAMGAGLALVAARSLALPRVGAVVASSAGLAMIVAAGVIFDTGTPFPGTAALLPTVGAALVIGAGLRDSTVGPSRILSTGPFRWMGRISYSLYLWHWPIIVLPATALETTLPLPARIALALLAILVAAASQRWVEDPIRRGRFVGLRPRRNLALAGALTLTVAMVSLGIGAWSFVGQGSGLGAPAPASGPGTDNILNLPVGIGPSGSPSGGSGSPSNGPGPSGQGGTPSPSSAAATAMPVTVGGPLPANLVPTLLQARADLPRIYGDGCHLDFSGIEPGTCVYGQAAGSPTVVLFGDSHAAQWFPTLERLAIARGWRLVSLTKSACSAADATVWNTALNRVYTECDAWRERALARIAAEDPDLVVMADSRGYTLALPGGPSPAQDHESLWDAAVARTLARLMPIARAVVLMGDTPKASVDPPVCLSKHRDDSLACATPAAVAIASAHLAAERTVAVAAGAVFVDPSPWVCPSDPCPVVIDQYLVYRDQQHLTATFAAALAGALVAVLPLPPP